jgi:hypothetical protein
MNKSTIKNYLLLILVINFFSCGDDDLSTTEQIDYMCLDEAIIVETTNTCESANLNGACSIFYAGKKALSSQLKSQFIDYCIPENNRILFEDSLGNTTAGRIDYKYYRTGNSTTYTNPFSSSCIGYCLENEEATTVIDSEKFSLRISLNSRLRGLIDTTDINKNIFCGFSIFAQKENTSQFVLGIDVENYLEEFIEPISSTTYTFHDSIVLNDASFLDVYSNQDFSPMGLERKEKVYFSVKEGVVAVRDSIGVLWTKR